MARGWHYTKLSLSSALLLSFSGMYVQYFGGIKNEVFFLRTSFSLNIQKAASIHVGHALLRVVPIGYAQRKGLDHGNNAIPWSGPSTNSRPRYSKNGVFLVSQIDSWQLY